MKFALGFLGVVLIAAGPFQAPASGAAAGPGPYLETQAEAGAATYKVVCARCHGAKLQGGFEEPPLAGPGFLQKWRVRTTADLLNFIETRMPPDRPGELGRDVNLTLVAHVLKMNGVTGAQPR
jgi:mono/diheme cytochrome c family protein